MKVFDLCCDADHVFEGWFASQEEFDAQLLARAVGCPLCGSVLIRRLPSASRLNLGSPSVSSAAAMPEPAQLQSALVRAALQIIQNTEDVGERFAEEALIIAHILVSLVAVIEHEHLAMLGGIHGARIDVDVGVNLERRYFEAFGF